MEIYIIASKIWRRAGTNPTLLQLHCAVSETKDSAESELDAFRIGKMLVTQQCGNTKYLELVWNHFLQCEKIELIKNPHYVMFVQESTIGFMECPPPPPVLAEVVEFIP